MKFRKESSSNSPKMDLLSRRSSTGRLSTFKRTKSFRASIRIMSKIRNHTSADCSNQTTNQNQSTISPQSKETIIKTSQWTLPFLQKKQQSDSLSSNKIEVNKKNQSKKNDDNSETRNIELLKNIESAKIAKDLKQKLSLTNRIMGRNRKGLQNNVNNNNNNNNNKRTDKREKSKSTPSSEQFEKSHYSQNTEKITGKKEYPVYPTGEYNSYENPTFCLDSSIDSSVNEFFFPVKNDDFDTTVKNTPTIIINENLKSSMETLTILVDSKRDNDKCSVINNFDRNEKKLSNDKTKYVNNEENGNHVILRSTMNKINETANNSQCEVTSEKVTSAKFLRPRTVDNITNFLNGGRSSFRVKKINHKKEVHESKDPESIIHDRVSMTTTFGSKLQSQQGMDFLEGFGKKKNQHHLNNLSSIHINPLTAQPSLNIHLHALFAAVEHGHIDKARTILESTDVDVNSVNSDGLSPLDVAVLSNNRPLAKMLVTFGAQEGNQFKSPDSLGSHLASLLSEAERRVQELGGSTSGSSGTTLLEPLSHRSSFSNPHNNLTGCSGNTEDKQLALWERRARALRKMLLGFNQARPPDKPYLVSVDVTGTTSVIARFQESDSHDSAICTKFKVQWSVKDDFSVYDEREVLDMKQRECRIDGLIQGQKYYFRAAAGNLKGYSKFRPSTPAYVTPSSWRDIDGRVPRFAGRLEQLDTLFTDIRGAEYTQETPAAQRRNHKKKTTIKQLFTATSKFQKNLRRGVFLACLLYNEDKILVTNEDFLPVIEIDETYPSCIYNDFHWLMKIACTWDDVKSLRQDMEKSHMSSTNHFRIKLLQAASQMQAALCTQNLGQLYYKPIRDIQGTLVFTTINYVKTPKLVSVLNSRWLPLSKITKKIITHEDSNVADILMASIQEQITYHQVSSIKLSRGLYLGYLKMQSSVDLIQVVVPVKSPNVLPHCKIRDNPHVSAEEWEYLKRMTRIQASSTSVLQDEEEKENASNESQGTEQQKQFIDIVSQTAKRLFSHMEINPEDSLVHRLYDAEVVDLTHNVSFLITVPPAETACSVPGTREILLQRGDLLSLPIQVFEMVHLMTYQKEVINRYSRMSCILELDTAQAQHNQREAFSTSELNIAKDKLMRLQDLQSQMNTVWKGARWLVDVITFARDRGSTLSNAQSAGICMKHLLSLDRNKNSGNSLKRSLLQLPPRDPKLVKSSPGRGSWPGPNITNSSSNLLTTEFSKSEQQLPSSQYIRKGSDTSNISSDTEQVKSSLPVSSTSNLSNSNNHHLIPLQNIRLPPSKSEDTLLLAKYKQSPKNRSVAVTSVSASTSPLLSIKPMMYGGSLLSVSTAMTNTTSLLSVSNNTNSDSMHSISSDEYSTPNSSVCIKTGHGKIKSSKPTASVAAMASGTIEGHRDEEKDEATMMPAPLPGILQDSSSLSDSC
ncbi:uncharacterized protein LOC122509277 isoform X4 [Leptopilina heterotoma]|uniref:uncharacterized protein LOC122509277 isoform X4 n=1 Tax=Leptopilina heterotoma TaxID=63436 RepID=UPI001CA9E05D|nr:uncharacterized protein LOC122509277 isoform X4 [Leptopilina heterotoma]